MATLTVTELDDGLVAQLQSQAARNRRSPEAEHREILRAALQRDTPLDRSAILDRLDRLRGEHGLSGTPPSQSLLAESRAARMRQLTGSSDAL